MAHNKKIKSSSNVIIRSTIHVGASVWRKKLPSVISLKELHASSSKISSVFRITFFRSRDHYHLVFFSVDVEALIKYATAHPIKMEGLKLKW